MKKSLILTASLALMTLTTNAQKQAERPNPRQSFEEFRKGLHDDYNSFRKEIGRAHV